MKKILFIILIAVFFWGCCTTEYVEVPVEIKPKLEPVPEREELPAKDPEQTLEQLLLSRVNYYSELVKLWESWAVSVYESIDLPMPESLKYLIIKTEGE